MDEYAFSDEKLKLLHDFAARAGPSTGDLGDAAAPPDSLLPLLAHIARFGVTCYPWEGIRVLLGQTFAASVVAFFEAHGGASTEEVQQRYARIRTSLDSMPMPPFTLQRLCEIVLEPRKHYSQTTKLLNAIEKLVRVQLPMSTLSAAEYNQCVLEGLETEQEAEEFRREDEERRQKIEAAAAEAAREQAQEADAEGSGALGGGEGTDMDVARGESESSENDALLAAADRKKSKQPPNEEAEVASMDVE